MADEQTVKLALAKVGLDALIDEATGYQQMRAPDALQRLFDRYLPANGDNWMSLLPDEFYRALWESGVWRERQEWNTPPLSVGNKAADWHLAATMGLMRAADSWEEFKAFIADAFERREA